MKLNMIGVVLEDIMVNSNHLPIKSNVYVMVMPI